METLHCYKDIIHYCVFQVNYKPYSTREKKLNFYIPVHGVGGNNTSFPTMFSPLKIVVAPIQTAQAGNLIINHLL
jgi:hypothetical protein